MAEGAFEVRIPAPLLHYGFSQEDVQRHLSEWLVLSLYTGGRVSSGKAARLLDVSRVEFLALLREHHIAYVDYTPQELKDELAAVETLDIPPQQ